MLLTDISNFIECKKVYIFNKKKISFNYIMTNSKNIKKFSIYAIEDNSKVNYNYIEEAISRGAVGVLTTKYIKNIRINQYIVKDINLSLILLLNLINPEKPKNSVAITGTNGKTSVSWYLSQICLLNNLPSKLYGTLGFYINMKKKNDTIHTTPNFDVLHQSAYLKIKNNYNFIFEVSSHSIKQKRINNFPIDIAAITNISHDHLDYHKTFKEYEKIKFKLFTNHLKHKGYAIINDNISNINNLKKIIKNKVSIVTYGKKNSNINLEINKKNIILKYFKDKYILKSVIYNKIELENIGCAIACAHCLNINIIKILKIIKKINNPPGRLQLVENRKNLKIFVDYAHTPEALKKVLVNFKENKIKPNIIFGCGGNRDSNKRSKMGIIANRYGNKVYITDDNPRNEDPSSIRKEILENCKKGIEIPDRKKAIFRAVKDLKKK